MCGCNSNSSSSSPDDWFFWDENIPGENAPVIWLTSEHGGEDDPDELMLLKRLDNGKWSVMFARYSKAKAIIPHKDSCWTKCELATPPDITWSTED